MPAVTVIVVTFNANHHLKRCLEALNDQTFADFRVIVVDNGLAEPAAQVTQGGPWHFPLDLMEPGRNLGFAAANNLAANATTSPWIALLNADAMPVSGWLERLMTATARYPADVMFGSLQRRTPETRPSAENDQEDLLDGQGDYYFAAGFPWRGSFSRPAEEIIPHDYEAFAPCAAAALYRRETYLGAGGLDERFFCYCEDVDLAFRLRLQGHRAVQVHDAVVWHAGSGITGGKSDFSAYHHFRNRWWLYLKNMPWPLLAATLPFHLLGVLGLLALYAREGRLTPALRGTWDGLKGTAGMLKTRSPRRVPLRALARAMSWNPRPFLTRRDDHKALAARAG